MDEVRELAPAPPGAADKPEHASVPPPSGGGWRNTVKNLSPRSRALAIAVIAVAAGALIYWFMTRAPAVRYTTVPASRGDVVTTITASGTINPVVVVQVGSFVSGVITKLSCDYNTRVKKGQLCAKIDPAPFQIIVDQDQAAVAVAKAQLAKDKVALIYAKITSHRAALLFKQDSGSHDAADAALNAYNQARALVDLDAAQVANKVAILRAAQINLNYTNIVSPVDGTVISRNVTAGQTVASSFQTPTLFLIATDLTKMQVDTNVSESDIAGAIKGASATFTVDAYPKRVFQGIVAQVRQAPISVQNVITYDVVLEADNKGLLLRPGMTATAKIDTAQARDVLRVPSQALRFTPASAAAPKVKRAANGGRTRTSARSGAQGVVWVQRAGKLVSVPVVTGLNDDAFVEIKSGDLAEGDQVVVAQASAGANAATGKPPPSGAPALRL